MFKHIVLLLSLLLFAASAHADLEGCHFELVGDDNTISVEMDVNIVDMFVAGSASDAAFTELAEEIEDTLGSAPNPGYYQVRFIPIVRFLWFQWPGAPSTLCFDLQEGQELVDAISPPGSDREEEEEDEDNEDEEERENEFEDEIEDFEFEDDWGDGDCSACTIEDWDEENQQWEEGDWIEEL